MEYFNTVFGKFKSKKIELVYKDKVVKTGILMDWKCQPFFFELFIKTEKSVSRVKMFYPFGYEEYGDDILEEKMELYLDFRLATFNSIVGMDFKVKEIENMPYHKYFNGILTITEV